MGLASILGLLEMERKTGIMLVERDDASARLFLRRGHVIRADCDQPRLTGAAAVFEALAWRGGSFDFLVGDIGGVDEIQTSTTFLLLEAARRVDEANEQRRAATTGANLKAVNPPGVHRALTSSCRPSAAAGGSTTSSSGASAACRGPDPGDHRRRRSSSPTAER